MSLYSTRSASSSLPALSPNLRRFPVFISLLVTLISISTIINNIIQIPSFFSSDFTAPRLFASATSIVLTCLLLAFCFGYIRKMWPPVLTALFAIIGIIKYVTATKFDELDDLAYYICDWWCYDRRLEWFGTVSGMPDVLARFIVFEVDYFTIETLRTFELFGIATPVFVCGLLIYIYWKQELKQNTHNKTL